MAQTYQKCGRGAWIEANRIGEFFDLIAFFGIASCVVVDFGSGFFRATFGRRQSRLSDK
jgi:hypothetical protein